MNTNPRDFSILLFIYIHILIHSSEVVHLHEVKVFCFPSWPVLPMFKIVTFPSSPAAVLFSKFSIHEVFYVDEKGAQTVV